MSEKYTKYTVLDFAQDAWFIKWVKNEHEEARQFWEKWSVEHPEKDQDLREARALVLAIKVKEEEPSGQKIRELWNEIDRRTETPSKGQKQAKRIALRPWLGYAAAACAALIFFVFIYNPTKTVSCAFGEHLTVYLPDSSYIELNAGSTIKFKPRKWAKTRSVTLEGEAFFEVKKGTTFTVVTAKGEVEVLGTSFNVNTRKRSFEVDCFSGKVKVSTGSHSTQILTKGEGTKLDSGSNLTAPSAFDNSRAASWREGKFYFQGASLREIFAEFERQFDVSIQTEEAILDKVGNAFFERENLDSALYKVIWPMGLQAERKGKVIVVK